MDTESHGSSIKKLKKRRLPDCQLNCKESIKLIYKK